ncbi:type IV pilus biogenesis/stability protein PilW [Halopseudomonas salegens]|uniref:Type IV pilus assembly protein PilF n=1 Tax=Halopseudomonas salegens TaxID=1434072 RepID=A0A1H2GVT0_9GAMM|nr:type IV pilus biogenesis/stability protein PilW [Halopseudomonas salegens]SDU23585.1 type IV pilus assembly protein PilF [Halopseudomonas salegens]
MSTTMLKIASLSLALMITACTTTMEQPTRKSDPAAAADAYIQLGLGYMQQGETERAKSPLTEALKLDSKSASAHVALALVFQQEGEYADAEKHFRAALASEPENPRILNNFGAFMLERERYEEARELFTKAADNPLYGERSRVFANLGLTELALDEQAAAKASFERSLRLNSRQPLALLELAKLQFAEQDYVGAWDNYLRFTQLSGQNASSLWLGYQLARRFEDHNRAASYALQLRRLYPASIEAQALGGADKP